MNTRKQVLAMVVLLMIGIIGIAIYSAWDPGRNTEAGEHFNEKVAKRGAFLFARNCRTCHGDAGEGGALGGRLAAAPALDRADLQGFVDSKATLTANISATETELAVSSGAAFATAKIILIDEERMEIKRVKGNTLTVGRAAEGTTADAHTSATAIQSLDATALKSQVSLITNTITCGRVGTPMPPWSQDHGGPLSDEQIRQLMVLITENHWELVTEEVDIEDAIGAVLQREIDESTISLPVTDISFFVEGEALRISEERMKITGVPRLDPTDKDKSGIIQVERGAFGSIPVPHTPEEGIFKFLLPPDAPTVTQQSCGQIARPAPVTAPPSEKPCADPCQTVDLVALGVAFDKKDISVKTGGNVRIHFTNNDVAVDHNVAVYQSATNLTAVATGSVGATFAGPNVIDDVVFAIPPAGSYYFRCDVHPTIMTGTFVVTP